MKALSSNDDGEEDELDIEKGKRTYNRDLSLMEAYHFENKREREPRSPDKNISSESVHVRERLLQIEWTILQNCVYLFEVGLPGVNTLIPTFLRAIIKEH